MDFSTSQNCSHSGSSSDRRHHRDLVSDSPTSTHAAAVYFPAAEGAEGGAVSASATGQVLSPERMAIPLSVGPLSLAAGPVSLPTGPVYLAAETVSVSSGPAASSSAKAVSSSASSSAAAKAGASSSSASSSLLQHWISAPDLIYRSPELIYRTPSAQLHYKSYPETGTASGLYRHDSSSRQQEYVHRFLTWQEAIEAKEAGTGSRTGSRTGTGSRAGTGAGTGARAGAAQTNMEIEDDSLTVKHFEETLNFKSFKNRSKLNITGGMKNHKKP